MSSDEAKRIARPRSVVVDWGSRGVVLTVHGDLYIYSITSKTLTRLTSAAGEEEEATFSPDGKLVAFVRDGNLFTVNVSSKNEHQLTTDGTKRLVNGLFDWVYQEEIYGRGIFKSYWWSPDSRSIAYLKIDDTHVPEFTVVDHLPVHQKLEVTPYPKSGDPNPAATLHVADLSTGNSIRLDRIADPSAMLIVDVAWRPDSSAVVFRFRTASRRGSTSTKCRATAATSIPSSSRDHEGVGRQSRQSVLPARRVVSLVERATPAGSTSTASAPTVSSAAHERRVGSAQAVRHRREKRLRVLLGGGARSDRHSTSIACNSTVQAGSG